MRTINRKQYEQLWDIACEEWQGKLENWFAHDLVCRKETDVLDIHYKVMRSAATASQNELLDSIFGKDEPEFKVGDLVVGWWKSSRYQDKIWKIVMIKDGYAYPKDDIVANTSLKHLRHATPSEIEAYKKENEVVRVYVWRLSNGEIDTIPDPIAGITPAPDGGVYLGYIDIKIKDLKQ